MTLRATEEALIPLWTAQIDKRPRKVGGRAALLSAAPYCSPRICKESERLEILVVIQYCLRSMRR